MTTRWRMVIVKRAWWRGGGFNVIEGNAAGRSLITVAPERVAWFRRRTHAELFIAIMRG